jgi:hypothetical protein
MKDELGLNLRGLEVEYIFTPASILGSVLSRSEMKMPGMKTNPPEAVAKALEIPF